MHPFSLSVRFVLAGALASTAAAQQVTASVDALFGNPVTTSVVIAGAPTSVGTPVSFDVNGGPYADPRAVFTTCIGPRNQDKSTISRQSWNSGAVALFVNVAGSRGFLPGSKGFVQINDPSWMIKEIVGGGDRSAEVERIGLSMADMSLNIVGSGFGLRVDRVHGRIEWCARGSCPDCACPENELDFVVILQERAPDQALFTLANTGPLYPGNDNLLLEGTLATANEGGQFILYAAVYADLASAPIQSFVRSLSVTPNTTVDVPLGTVDTASMSKGTYYTSWQVFRRSELAPQLIGTDMLFRLPSQPGACP